MPYPCNRKCLRSYKRNSNRTRKPFVHIYKSAQTRYTCRRRYCKVLWDARGQNESCRRSASLQIQDTVAKESKELSVPYGTGNMDWLRKAQPQRYYRRGIKARYAFCRLYRSCWMPQGAYRRSSRRKQGGSGAWSAYYRQNESKNGRRKQEDRS